ncbi:hypothetical protein [Haloarcula sediminis]|uniref:hypothetical protein n=1 Tax=Haloarcula sediminis TaxID=3111777 RepID=UPI002D7963C2|nr:hypothetical protein [Haloarcula sp. CK38]
MKVTDKRLQAGDTLELGENIHATNEQVPRGGGLNITVVHDGDAKEYVVLRTQVEDGDELGKSEILALTDGSGMMSGSWAWQLVPASAYGGDAE